MLVGKVLPACSASASASTTNEVVVAYPLPSIDNSIVLVGDWLLLTVTSQTSLSFGFNILLHSRTSSAIIRVYCNCRNSFKCVAGPLLLCIEIEPSAFLSNAQ